MHDITQAGRGGGWKLGGDGGHIDRLLARRLGKCPVRFVKIGLGGVNDEAGGGGGGG